MTDVQVEHNGKTYTLMPSKSGDFEQVINICGDLGLMVFEPRNQTEYDAVYTDAKELGMGIVYLNIQRKKSGIQVRPYRFSISYVTSILQVFF